MKISNKKNETSGADVKSGEVVPHERAYAVELYALMTSGLPPSFQKDVEVNAPSTNEKKPCRADIVVTNSRKERVVVEMMAHDRDGPISRKASVLGHVQRCAKSYMKISGVKEAWVLHVIYLSLFLHYSVIW